MGTLVNSIGVNLHIPDQATPYYSNWPGVLNLLTSLGVKHFRDSAWPSNWGEYARIHQDHLDLANIGKLDLLWNVQYDASFLSSVASQEPGLETLEGPNELDNTGSSTWPIATFNSNADLLASARPGITILAPSLTQPTSPGEVENILNKVDFANFHIYFANRNPETSGWGANGYGSLTWNEITFNPSGLAHTFVTETGYGSELPDSIRVQYILRTLLYNYNRKVTRTFVYQFVASGTDAYSTYGFVNNDLSLRPDYIGLRNLISLAGDGTLAALPTGEITAPSSVYVVPVQKSDGSWLVFLWQPTQNSDPSTKTVTLPSPVNVSVAAGAFTKQHTFQGDGSLLQRTITGNSVQVADKVVVLSL